MKLFFKILVIFLCLNFTHLAYSQERTRLEKEKEENIDKIKYTRTLLDKTKAKKASSVSQLNLLNEAISIREALVRTLESELLTIERDIKNIEVRVEENLEQLKDLKEDYARIIKNSYRNIEEENVWMYILSSEDFNQAYQRIKYIKYLNQYRRSTVEEIEALNDSLDAAGVILQERKRDKTVAINELNEEHSKLQQDRSEKAETLGELRKQERELIKELRRREKIQAEIEAEIRRIIEEEARKARESNLTAKLTPEEKLVSDNFVYNKGRLPWPTEQGVITGRFGEHPHPVLPGIKIKSNGIDISTTQGSNVRSIFEGEVTKVMAILGANYTVIVKHGNYRTVYQNLVDVKVKAGDKLQTKEYIGKAGTGDDNISRVHFQVWEEKSPQNPELWLSR